MRIFQFFFFRCDLDDFVLFLLPRLIFHLDCELSKEWRIKFMEYKVSLYRI